MRRRSRSAGIAVAVLMVWLGVSSAWSGTLQGSGMSGDAESRNEAVVREFIAAWSRLDPDELVSYFTSDGTYHNMPMAPVTGRENLRQFIAGFLVSWEKTDWEVISLVADGDLVIAERVDRTLAGGRYVELPCVGVFEMEDGRIRIWRDYFDMQTYVNAITPVEESIPQ
ncbi:MAG: limonene-1,2-epoxide hydrolase family protein [Pseudomonadales bacterium]